MLFGYDKIVSSSQLPPAGTRVLPYGTIKQGVIEHNFLATARQFTALDINSGWQSETVKKREAADRYGDRDEDYKVYDQRSTDV